MDLNKAYNGKNVLVTGGLGFIGSNLAIRLVGLGAKVTVLDARLNPYGHNDFNLMPVRDQLEVVEGDIRDKGLMIKSVKGRDAIFNMAAQVGEKIALQDPFLDVDINCNGHLSVLEACRVANPEARLVFPGSRFQYGKLNGLLPVDELHPLNPLSMYGITKTAGEQYYLAYNRIHGLNTAAARIANPFGPRAQVRHPGYCVANWFVRQALEGKELGVFGDGEQTRDYIYIDDLVDALLHIGAHPEAGGRVFNAGSGFGTMFVEMANKAVAYAGSGKVSFKPWPAEYAKFETGDFVADISKIRRLGWEPRVEFSEGLKRTVEFYRDNLAHYT